MSDVKMCDKPSCKKIFSVQSGGWTSLGGVQKYRDTATGQLKERQAEQDICGPCNGVPEEPGTYAIISNPNDHRELEAAQAEADMWRARYEAERAHTPIPEDSSAIGQPCVKHGRIGCAWCIPGPNAA